MISHMQRWDRLQSYFKHLLYARCCIVSGIVHGKIVFSLVESSSSSLLIGKGSPREYAVTSWIYSAEIMESVGRIQQPTSRREISLAWEPEVTFVMSGFNLYSYWDMVHFSRFIYEKIVLFLRARVPSHWNLFLSVNYCVVLVWFWLLYQVSVS